MLLYPYTVTCIIVPCSESFRLSLFVLPYSNNWYKHFLIHLQRIILYLDYWAVIWDWNLKEEKKHNHLKEITKKKKTSIHINCRPLYLSLGVSRLELAKETTLLDGFDSLWASLNKRRYSSPFAKGSGVVLSGLLTPAMVAAVLSSIHDSKIELQKETTFKCIHFSDAHLYTQFATLKSNK